LAGSLSRVLDYYVLPRFPAEFFLLLMLLVLLLLLLLL
jgi:hypothetical protein